MKKPHDFSKGERGKFYRPDAKLNIPVYLDEEVQPLVARLAREKGTDVSAVVNDMLRSDMGLAKTR